MKKTKPNKEKCAGTFIVLVILSLLIAFAVIIVNLPENISKTKEIAIGKTEKQESTIIENNIKKIEIGELNLKLEVTKGKSPLKNGWYNSEEVEVTLTVENEIEESKIKEKGIVYGTRLKGSKETPNDIKKLESKQEKITITEEGITEIVVYREVEDQANKNIENNKQAEPQTMNIKIDRTPPTVNSLKCTQTEDNKITMVAEGTRDNDGGSGVEEYVFFTENDASPEKLMRSKTNEISFNTNTGVNLGQAVIQDKAGNISVICNSVTPKNASAMIYTYDVYWTKYGNENYYSSHGWYLCNLTTIPLATRNASGRVCFLNGIYGCCSHPHINNCWGHQQVCSISQRLHWSVTIYSSWTSTKQ